MESRLERNKKLKREKRITCLKAICILLLSLLFWAGIDMVNQSMIRLNNWTENKLFAYDMTTRELNILGKTYIIDISYIKNK